MRLKIANQSKRCDTKGCKNTADFSIDIKGVFKNQFCFCEECLKKMFKGYLGTCVPKSIEAPFKPKSRIRKEER